MKKKKKKHTNVPKHVQGRVLGWFHVTCGCCCHVGNDINLGEAGVGGEGL